jgi:hypothetical protein
MRGVVSGGFGWSERWDPTSSSWVKLPPGASLAMMSGSTGKELLRKYLPESEIPADTPSGW